jgi:hypothetical protein
VKERHVTFCTGGVATLAMGVLLTAGLGAQQKTPVKVPEAGVPQIMTLEGEYVRIAYNNEGYVSMGYRIANDSVGSEWIMLEVAATVRAGVPAYKLTRSAITLDTPDAKGIPMPTNEAYRNVDLRSMEMRARTVVDSIDYFPPDVRQANCRIGFFASIESGARAFDDVELNSSRGCLGRLYFKIPGGLKYGQHWLNVKFQNSLVRVPFRILTAEEVKTFSKSWKDIKKQVDEAFKKGRGGADLPGAAR